MVIVDHFRPLELVGPPYGQNSMAEIMGVILTTEPWEPIFQVVEGWFHPSFSDQDAIFFLVIAVTTTRWRPGYLDICQGNVDAKTFLSWKKTQVQKKYLYPNHFLFVVRFYQI